MPDPGYGSNGERRDPSGLVTWSANAPPEAVPEGWDHWWIYPLGLIPLPWINQDEDEAWQSVYPGG